MPASAAFARKLDDVLPQLLAVLPTPFYVYDLEGMLAAHRSLQQAFGHHGFKQYFAVKALPNPAILARLVAVGSGLDCSSPVELELADSVGASGSDIVFTPNNVAGSEYDAAIRRGALVTFDDRSALQSVDRLPEIVSFRAARSADGDAQANAMMGSHAGTKFGVPRPELVVAYRDAFAQGARRFGIHSMTLANELCATRMAEAAAEVVTMAAEVSEKLGTQLEFINFGGGLGIPYRAADEPFDLAAYARAILHALDDRFGTRAPRVVFECGRFVTGPHGVLVTRAVSRASKARVVVGVDACMSALMRPGIYPSAWHHISALTERDAPTLSVDVVGALCENNDKFGVGRELADPRPGDVLLIHDCGAHGHAMGFNYNGRLRPAEVLLDSDGRVVLIRRAESINDYVATLTNQSLFAASSLTLPALYS